MALLTNNDRQALWADFMQQLSERRESLGLSKTDLRAAVDATDQWIDDNAASYNGALPIEARTTLTAAQKVELFNLVAARRFAVV